MSTITEQQFGDWQQAIGTRKLCSQYLDEESARRYAVAAGLSAETPSSLVHWAWFLQAVPDREIGPDGHSRRGAFLPAISLPRRMFASAKIEFHQVLTLERRAEISIEVKDLFRKAGSQGELVFVVVERIISQQHVPCIKELQTIAYMNQGDSVALPENKFFAVQQGDEAWTPDAVNLFRFSSVTFNSHRYHYDQRYAKEVEGYPDLVVQGPYTATKLADFAARKGALASFEFRGLAPLFQGQQVVLREVSNEVVQALRCDGVVALEAKVAYR